MSKYLDANGLQHLWTKIKELIFIASKPYILGCNYSLIQQVILAATRTAIIGTGLSLSADIIQQGMRIRWIFDVSKTAAGTASGTIDIAIGTTGTTADAAKVTFTKPAGTAVVDNGRFVVEALFRNTGASAQLVAHLNMTHNLAATGLAKTPCIDITTVSSTFDMSADVAISLCIKTGAADVYTIQMVQTELYNI